MGEGAGGREGEAGMGRKKKPRTRRMMDEVGKRAEVGEGGWEREEKDRGRSQCVGPRMQAGRESSCSSRLDGWQGPEWKSWLTAAEMRGGRGGEGRGGIFVSSVVDV